MTIVLCDVNRNIINACTEAFKDCEDVATYWGSFQNLLESIAPGETFFLCTAGNSYGVMGGGIDLQIARYFPGIELEVQKKIYEAFFGELPVGSFVPVEIGPAYNSKVQALFYIPTMISPSSIEGTTNVYFAMRAALQAYYHFSKIPSYNGAKLIVPGFGGQCGRMPSKVIARQMKLAYDRVKNIQQPRTTGEMHALHCEVAELKWE